MGSIVLQFAGSVVPEEFVVEWVYGTVRPVGDQVLGTSIVRIGHGFC